MCRDTFSPTTDRATKLPRRLRRAVSFAVILLVATISSALAQTEIGELTRARTISAPGECPELANAPTVEMVDIRRGTVWTTTSPPAKLFAADAVRKPGAVLARVRIDAAAQGSGVLYLVPSVECYPGIRTNTRIAGPLPLGQTSEYEISSRPVVVGSLREQRLAVAINRGALIVQWNRGAPLMVLAVTDTIVITGTTVAFSVDSAGSQGIVYVQEGTVAISRLPGGPVGPGEIVRLRRGQPPVRAPASGAAETMNNAVNYYQGPAWSLRPVPFLQVGFKAGSTFSEIDGVMFDGGVEVERLRSIGGGGFIRFGTGIISVQAEVDVARRGYAFSDGRGKFEIDYIDVPIFVRVGPGGTFGPYMMVGGSYGVETGCTFDVVGFQNARTSIDCDDPQIASAIEKSDIGAAAVVGLELRLGAGSVFAEGRYTHGLTNIRAGEGPEFRNRSFGVMAGISFGIGAR